MTRVSCVWQGVIMRETGQMSGSLFSYIDLEGRIPAAHPSRKIRQIVNGALASLHGLRPALFDQRAAFDRAWAASEHGGKQRGTIARAPGSRTCKTTKTRQV